MTADTLTKDESIRLMQAEIERLREGYEQCRATLKHVAADRDEKESEIQRLRGLLREGIGDIWIKNADGSFTCMYEAIAAWHKRVREALGE